MLTFLFLGIRTEKILILPTTALTSHTLTVMMVVIALLASLYAYWVSSLRPFTQFLISLNKTYVSMSVCSHMVVLLIALVSTIRPRLW